MRIVDKLAVPLIFIAGGMVYLAEKFELPFLTTLAIAIFGVFALLLGADTIRLISGSAHSREQRSQLVDLGFRFFG